MSYPLEYTPRKFAVHQDSGHLIIIETDHNAYTEETKQARKLQMAEVRTVFFSVFVRSRMRTAVGGFQVDAR